MSFNLFCCFSLDMVHLPGKRNRKVPLLLKPEWVKAMQLLVATRAKCDIISCSEYFFAVPGKESHIPPWKVCYYIEMSLFYKLSEFVLIEYNRLGYGCCPVAVNIKNNVRDYVFSGRTHGQCNVHITE